MKTRAIGVVGFFLLILLSMIALVLTGILRVDAPMGYIWSANSVSIPQSVNQSSSVRLMNGKIASLGWIVGRDCQRGMRAYLQTADINPDAALGGTGWLDPTTGQLLQGASNNCAPGTLSMDNVIQLIHNKGGKAYLTVTMQTDGTASSWTSQQESTYIDQATSNQGYIDTIINEVQRGHYDGVIMDLEGGDRGYPNIQQLFATYNQRVWNALKPLHKPYGIALIHKLSDHDDYYNLNGFENWSLLGKSADFIVVMSLDQSYFSPGPTVSVPWLKQLLAYALQTMPQMLPHIVWEMPLYGAMWRQDTAGNWVFDGGINYLDAVKLVSQIPHAQIDTANTNLEDPYCAHIVYTDSTGVTHSVWYHTAKNLYNIVSEFKAILDHTPQFSNPGGQFQIAAWYRATWEPGDLWRMLTNVVPN